MVSRSVLDDVESFGSELGGALEHVATVREFVDADLIDTMHVAVVDIELGRGGKLWDSPDELLDHFHLERIPSPSGATHHISWHNHSP